MQALSQLSYGPEKGARSLETHPCTVNTQPCPTAHEPEAGCMNPPGSEPGGERFPGSSEDHRRMIVKLHTHSLTVGVTKRNHISFRRQAHQGGVMSPSGVTPTKAVSCHLPASRPPRRCHITFRRHAHQGGAISPSGVTPTKAMSCHLPASRPPRRCHVTFRRHPSKVESH